MNKVCSCLNCRQPLPLVSYDNIALPFSAEVWALFWPTLLSLAVAMWAAHRVLLLSGSGVTRRERSQENFLIFTFAKVTEPGMCM